MVELAGFAILFFGAFYGAVEAKRTWNVGFAVLAFVGCFVAGFVLMAIIPFIGWLCGAVPAIAFVRHAQATRFRALASGDDDPPTGMLSD